MGTDFRVESITNADLFERPIEASRVDVVGVLAADRRPGVVLVVGADDRLMGWILEDRLETDLMLMVLPDVVKEAADELGAHAARGLMQTAADLMTDAGTVTIGTSI